MPKQSNTAVFPKDFLWGASTSAHQVEGGTHNQWTEWELEHARALASQAEYQYGDLPSWPRIKAEAKLPDNYVSGKASGHYALYEKDFDILKKLGLSAFRFSIEWSRIEPTEGVWDVAAIQHYKQYIAALKARDVEPIMTLFHFTLPVWFAKKGGFEKRGNTTYFVRFAEKVLNELGSDIRYVITINEPEVYAYESYREGNWPPAHQNKWLAWRVLSNLIRAHNQTAKMIHQLNRRYEVSIAKNASYTYPGDDAWLTRLASVIGQYLRDDYVLRRVRKQCDFIGVNYYFSNRFYGYRVHNPDQRLSDLGWDMAPQNLQYVLERLSVKYQKPIIITENGVADGDDSQRAWWLASTMSALSAARKNGADVRGYMHWSLLDNFEWEKGKWPRFGLVAVNYVTMKRTVRPSAKKFAKYIASTQKGSIL